MNTTTKAIALIDINNFYVSAERVFRPEYNGVPAIVLSNNDATIVARSQEAKNLNIPMGVPLFKIKDIIEQNNVVLLSSNYEVYAEMSRRFANIVKTFVSEKDVEQYSIDELFADLSSYKNIDLSALSRQIKDTLLKHIGLPVCVGIGASKTEAKFANFLAKKNPHFNGVCNLVEMDYCAKEALFQSVDVGEVWGVGRRHKDKLNALGIKTVYDLAIAPPEFIKAQFSVVMQRTVLELSGISCIEIEEIPQPKKQIVSSKSFGNKVSDMDSICEAMSSFLQKAFQRLRSDNSLCGCIIAFAESNRFDASKPFFKRSVTIGLTEPTDSAFVANKAVMAQMANIFQEGIEYKKCGVVLTGIEPKASYIRDLLSDIDAIEKYENLQSAMDQVKKKYGNTKLAIGSCQIPNRAWSMNRNRLTQNYFSIDGLLEITK